MPALKKNHSTRQTGVFRGPLAYPVFLDGTVIPYGAPHVPARLFRIDELLLDRRP